MHDARQSIHAGLALRVGGSGRSEFWDSTLSLSFDDAERLRAGRCCWPWNIFYGGCCQGPGRRATPGQAGCPQAVPGAVAAPVWCSSLLFLQWDQYC